MKTYEVTKCEANGTEKHYGVMCEEDMKLVTRGYKKDENFSNLYMRKGSQSFFIVDEK